MPTLAFARACRGHLLAACLLTTGLWSASTPASTTPLASPSLLADTIRQDGLAARLLIRSEERGDTARGSVDAIVDYPFAQLTAALDGIEPWCEITFLHFNIKACVYDDNGDDALVTLYSGRMHYQTPEQSYRNQYIFREETRNAQQLSVSILGEDGPFGTRDYVIRIEAAPLDDARSLIRLSYSVSYGALTRMAQRLYFTTAGRHRVGFSQDGNRPVRGLRGMMERNTMRFYLALQAYLESPAEDALAQRLARWHALTLDYPEQLKEIPLDDYLDSKRREYQHQEALQQATGSD